MEEIGIGYQQVSEVLTKMGDKAFRNLSYCNWKYLERIYSSNPKQVKGVSERGCSEIIKMESIKLNYCDLCSNFLMKGEIP